MGGRQLCESAWERGSLGLSAVPLGSSGGVMLQCQEGLVTEAMATEGGGRRNEELVYMEYKFKAEIQVKHRIGKKKNNRNISDDKAETLRWGSLDLPLIPDGQNQNPVISRHRVPDTRGPGGRGIPPATQGIRAGGEVYGASAPPTRVSQPLACTWNLVLEQFMPGRSLSSCPV